MTTVSIPYNKNTPVIFIVLLSLLLGFPVSQLHVFIQSKDNTSVIGLSVLIIVILTMILFLTFKRLIPAFTGKAALELNNQGIISYVKNVKIAWNKIENIEVQTTRSSSYIDIKLKKETDWKRHVSIQLQWISGSDDEIYNSILAYFESTK